MGAGRDGTALYGLGDARPRRERCRAILPAPRQPATAGRRPRATHCSPGRQAMREAAAFTTPAAIRDKSAALGRCRRFRRRESGDCLLPARAGLLPLSKSSRARPHDGRGATSLMPCHFRAGREAATLDIRLRYATGRKMPPIRAFRRRRHAYAAHYANIFGIFRRHFRVLMILR